MTTKEILIEELEESTHIERVEDVIYWALEAYCKDRYSNGSMVAYAIKDRIDRNEKSKCESDIL